MSQKRCSRHLLPRGGGMIILIQHNVFLDFLWMSNTLQGTRLPFYLSLQINLPFMAKIFCQS